MPMEFQIDGGDEAWIRAPIFALERDFHVPDHAALLEFRCETLVLFRVCKKVEFARTFANDLFTEIARISGELLIDVDILSGFEIDDRHGVEVLIVELPRGLLARAKLLLGLVTLGDYAL